MAGHTTGTLARCSDGLQMRTFSGLEAFGAFLNALGVQAEERAAQALREGAHAVAANAQARIGHYDGNDWPQLAASTQAERKALGFAPNDPLLRTGTLHNAITSEGKGREAVAGVKSGTAHDDGTDVGDIAVDQEMGTGIIPPRPYLGPAGMSEAPKVAKAVAKAAADAILGSMPRSNAGGAEK